MRALFLLGSIAMGLFTGSCAPHAAEPTPEQNAALPEGVAARVGQETISTASAARSAAAQGIDMVAAARGQVRDALFALGARRAQLDETPAVRVAVRAELSRAVLEQLRVEADASPPSDQEVAEVTAEHFVEMDRPEAFRVIHTVAQLPKGADAASRARVRSVAERVAKAVASASTRDAFRQAAESVAHPDVELKTEELPAMTEDGRMVDLHNPSARGTFVADFAHAAARLQAPGQKSALVETRFGYHVMMLLERVPAFSLPLEERRARLADEIASRRAQDRMDALVERLQKERAPAIERSAESLIRALVVEPR